MQTLTKIKADTWIHNWPTGWQELTFSNDAAAMRWASANDCEYSDCTQQR